ADAQAEYVKKWNAARERLAADLDAIAAVADDAQRDSLASVRRSIEAYAAGFSAVRADVDSGAITTPQAGHGAPVQYQDHIRQDGDILGEIAAASTQDRQRDEAVIEADATRGRWLILAGGLAMLACAVLAGILLRRQIVPPLAKLTAIADCVASGEIE